MLEKKKKRFIELKKNVLLPKCELSEPNVKSHDNDSY